MFDAIINKNKLTLVNNITKAYAKKFKAFNKKMARELRKKNALYVPTLYDEFQFVVNGILPDDLTQRLVDLGYRCDVSYDEEIRGITTISRRYYPD